MGHILRAGRVLRHDILASGTVYGLRSWIRSQSCPTTFASVMLLATYSHETCHAPTPLVFSCRPCIA